MKPLDLNGAVIDSFSYDAPGQPDADFHALCDADTPLVLVFFPNIGHPISRVYLTRYKNTLSQLTAGRLACVVRTPAKVAEEKLPAGYPLYFICDPDADIYDSLAVQTTTSRMRWSMEAARIFREAKKQGFVLDKKAPQILPLTLVLGRGGKVLFYHYGESLTDLPEDCRAIQRICEKLALPETQRPPVQAVCPQSPAAAQVPAAPAQEPENQPENDTAANLDETQQLDLTGWLDHTENG